jgi:hypothetical protein
MAASAKRNRERFVPSLAHLGRAVGNNVKNNVKRNVKKSV